MNHKYTLNSILLSIIPKHIGYIVLVAPFGYCNRYLWVYQWIPGNGSVIRWFASHPIFHLKTLTFK